MLPSGLQMLPLLWLLWMPKLGLSSPQSPGDVSAGPVPEGISALHNRPCDGVGEEINKVEPEEVVEATAKEEPEQETEYYPEDITIIPLVGSTNAIYRQFKKSHHSVYIVFNKTAIREAVPESASLFRAELELHSLNRRGAQTVLLFEKYGKSWRFIRKWMSALSNKARWLTLDVTGVVCQWLKNQEEFKVFRLTAERLPDNKDNVLHMEISGINPTYYDEFFHKNDGISIYHPTLNIVTTPVAHREDVDCIRHH